MIPRILIAACCTAVLAAQQFKVVPKGMDFVEGPSVSTPPFSATNSGIQMLIDASEVTTGIGFVSALRFRPSQVTSGQSSAGFTKNYQVTMYTVAMNAAQFEALATPYDFNTVIGGATPTVVFNGPVTLPPIGGPAAVVPQTFSIPLVFSTPYFFDGSQGNLLIMVETADLTPTPGTYRVDAVQFRETDVTGLAVPIDTAGCVVNGANLTTSISGASVIDGGVIDVNLSSSPPTAFPAAIAALGLTRADIDLGLLGLPGCTSRLGTVDFSQLVFATSGVFPVVTWSIPGDPALRGLALVAQSLGLAASGNFQDSAISNALALRIGANTLPVIPTVMYGFRTQASSPTSWFKGTTGQISPVVQLEGIFP